MERKNLFQITWPIFIEVLMFMLMGVADTLMLSNYSDEAVAAVGMSNQVLNVVGVLINVVSLGVTVLISQYIGAKKLKESHEVALTGLVMNFLFGIGFTIFLVTMSKYILVLMNTPQEILETTKQYTRIVGYSMFIWATVATSGAIMRSNGYTKITMYTIIGANIVNVIGNYLLIFGIGAFPELGPIGAAISTTFSRSLLIIVSLTILFKTIPFTLTHDYKHHFLGYVKNLLKIGIPSAAENFSYTLSQSVIVSLIATLGTEALTTRIYAFTISMFIFLLSIAVGNGNQIVTGYYVGEQDFEGAYKHTLKVNFTTMLITTSVALVVALTSKHLVGLLTTNEEIIQVTTRILWISVLLEPGRTINLIVIQSLRASGDTIFPVVMAIISMWGVAVLGSYLSIKMGYGIIGVWVAYALDEWVRGIAMLFRWKSKVWITKAFVHK